MKHWASAASKEKLQAVLDSIEMGEPTALVTVVRAQGSTPRHLGAKMVVNADGSLGGSIGGGSLEFRVIRDAQQALLEGQPRLIEYDLAGNGPESVGLCGGAEAVFMDVFLPGSEETRIGTTILQELVKALKEDKRTVLATVVQGGTRDPWRSGAKMVIHANGSTTGTIARGDVENAILVEAQQAYDDGNSRRLGFVAETMHVERLNSSEKAEVEIFLDVFEPEPKLVIFGAGHIGAALTNLAKLLDMHVVVVDDRFPYANSDHVADADEIVVVDYDAEKETLNQIPVAITSATYVVIATWGWDEPVLRQVADSPAAYIGLVASSRKAAILFQDLLKRGLNRAALDRVRVPVGLDLGAETPGEIALSIMAEILMVRRGRSGQPLSERKAKRSESASRQADRRW